MKRGKGMKFVGDSRVPLNANPIFLKTILNTWENRSFLAGLSIKRMDGWRVFLIGFLCLRLLDPSPLERIADPTDTAYHPVPDWYFLFLYQFIKYHLCFWSI